MGETAATHDRIAWIFSDQLHLEVPSIDTDLFDTGVLDSLAFVELLLQLERVFGITTSVDDLDIANFRTIAHISRFVAVHDAADRPASNPSRVVLLGSRR